MMTSRYQGKTVAELTDGRTIDPYDRLAASLNDLPDVTKTKPSTVRVIHPLIGASQTYIVQTFRQAEEGDTVFVEYIGPEGSYRFALPPKVARAIHAQRESLTTTTRKRTAKRVAAERKAAGIQPGFMKNRGGKRKEKS